MTLSVLVSLCSGKAPYPVSTSKTFTGLAVGFAVQDGLLSLEDHVVDFFPERLPSKPGGNMQKMKVKHLLTMSTGFAKDPHDFPGLVRMTSMEPVLTAAIRA